MHTRKTFLVYPVDYDPHSSGRYKKTYSKYQAKKCARRLGYGSQIDESVHKHEKSHVRWFSSSTGRTWEYAK